MNAATAPLAARRPGVRPLAIGLALLIAVAGLLTVLRGFVPLEPMLRGWLVAWAMFGAVPVGSMTWLMIHRLTRGEWGLAAAPVLRPAAAMTPLLIIGFIPVLAGLAAIYPWAANPGVIPTDVAHWYLNGPAFLIRSLVALGGWSLLGILFAAGSGSRLLAGLGLAFFGLTISLVAVDWYLSLEPHYVATAFAAMIAIQQLLMALAVAGLVGPPAIDGRVAGDLGGLLIATLLGVVYLEFMTFVIAWYGDQSEKADWFLRRAGPAWIALLIAALVFGAILPFALLLVQRIRRSRRGLRLASALILGGSAMHLVWLLLPAFDHQAGVVAAAGGSAAILALVSILTGPAMAQWLEARHAE
jgi:hypothetical protein